MLVSGRSNNSIYGHFVIGSVHLGK